MKRNVEIDDTLNERVADAVSEVREDFVNYLSENVGMVEFDEYYQAQGAEKANEAADSNTPIYFSEIDGLYYLYGNELEEAYKNAGIGNGKEDNYRQVTLYCYISEKCHEYLNTLQKWHEDEYLEEVERLTGENDEAADHKDALGKWIEDNAPKA